jgi:hypothetical protein
MEMARYIEAGGLWRFHGGGGCYWVSFCGKIEETRKKGERGQQGQNREGKKSI